MFNLSNGACNMMQPTALALADVLDILTSDIIGFRTLEIGSLKLL